jgi:hypothetical protein
MITGMVKWAIASEIPAAQLSDYRKKNPFTINQYPVKLMEVTDSRAIILIKKRNETSSK